MKKRLSLSAALMLTALLTLPVPARADEAPSSVPEEPTGYTILVGLQKQALDLTALPCQPYRENEVLMVPLAKVSQALGYQVSWDPETGNITVDDGYIQKAVLHHGTAEAYFTGHLNIVDLSREVDNAAPTNVIDGRAFVPLSFFREFSNTVTLEDSIVSIAPSMMHLDQSPTV